ncbi:MAG: hypothetical protein KIG16_01015 [Eubacteriales bacterium]|nr:hypothetical protein [Eubacteriales bacterium]
MKLKFFRPGQVTLKQQNNTQQNEQDETEKSKLIQYISDRSDRYGDKLLEFMDLYGLYNLQSATVSQLYDYIASHMQCGQQEQDQIK